MAGPIAGTVTYNNPQTGTVGTFGTTTGSGTQTYGVLVAAPSGSIVKLTDFTFYWQGDGTIPYQVAVYAWNGSHATGSAVFSGNYSMTGTGSMQPVTTTIPGGATLTGGETYVLFFTTSDPGSVALSTGAGSWFFGTADNLLPNDEGGDFVWYNNGTDYGLLFSSTWDNTGDGYYGALIADFTTGGPTATTTTVTRTAGGSPATYGSLLTFQAVASPDPGDGSTITFYTNGVAFGTATTISGTASLTENNLAYSGGSAFTVTATFAGNSNYATSTGTLSGGQQVNQASLSITANNDTKIYGATKTYGAGSAAFSSSGLQNGETIGSVTLASSGAVATAGATTYAITPSATTGGTFNANNYSITYNAGTLVVQPAALTIIGIDATRPYGTTNPVFAVTGNGFVNGDSLANLSGTLSVSFTDTNKVAESVDTNTPVGVYDVIPSGLTSANYNIAFTNGTITIVPASLIVTANNLANT
ncbi:MAG: MBG domain-containing protein, partial [Verrucomicrobiota bacterium]